MPLASRKLVLSHAKSPISASAVKPLKRCALSQQKKHLNLQKDSQVKLAAPYPLSRAHGQRVFYTTPLKALSNQKLRDFREQFGAHRVGLMTGDLTANREAPIVVMTTEIFRNMLYAEIDHSDAPLEGVEAVFRKSCLV